MWLGLSLTLWILHQEVHTMYSRYRRHTQCHALAPPSSRQGWRECCRIGYLYFQPVTDDSHWTDLSEAASEPRSLSVFCAFMSLCLTSVPLGCWQVYRMDSVLSNRTSPTLSYSTSIWLVVQLITWSITPLPSSNLSPLLTSACAKIIWTILSLNNTCYNTVRRSIRI